jgi:molybdate transport system regulatory protein
MKYEPMNQNLIFAISEDNPCLDQTQLQQMEQSFRQWTDASRRKDVRISRRRILIIFLLIRYTGAKLNEILTLDPFEDIDFDHHTVCFKNEGLNKKDEFRIVYISSLLSEEIQKFLNDPDFKDFIKDGFGIDPGFVRLKFYNRAESCGFPKHLGGPEMIRKARAIELMQGNMPVHAVQKMLGHSSPGRTSSYISFSETDIQAAIKWFIEKESSRKTSARNSFFGKIKTICKGDIQALVTLTTINGHTVTTMITNNSLEQLALKEGKLVTAEIKAPWIMIQKGKDPPASSADNQFAGTIEQINPGAVSTEYSLRISDGTVLCAVISAESARELALKVNDPAWAIFNCFSVVLNVD